MKARLKVGDKVIDTNWHGIVHGTVTSVIPLRIAFRDVKGYGDTEVIINEDWLRDICLSPIGHVGRPCVFCGEDK